MTEQEYALKAHEPVFRTGITSINGVEKDIVTVCCKQMGKCYLADGVEKCLEFDYNSGQYFFTNATSFGLYDTQYLAANICESAESMHRCASGYDWVLRAFGKYIHGKDYTLRVNDHPLKGMAWDIQDSQRKH